MAELFTVLIALGAAIAVAALAYRWRALRLDGAIAAVAVGTAVVAAGGWWWGVVLVTFFASSSALSRWRRSGATGIAARGSRRDAVQVLANGGIAAALALAAMIGDRALLFAAFAGAIAAATADTWATELGKHSRHRPRLITTGRAVPAGTSGGVTVAGTLASLAGAGLIGLVAGLGAAAGWAPTPRSPIVLVLAVTLAGVAGALVDSLLGATVQATYHCPSCRVATEQRVHRCGRRTEHRRGWPPVTNDTVNALATAVGAAVAASLLDAILTGAYS